MRICGADRFSGGSEATFFDQAPYRTFRRESLRENEVSGQSQECSQNEQGHADDAPGPAPVAFEEVGGVHGLLGYRGLRCGGLGVVSSRRI